MHALADLRESLPSSKVLLPSDKDWVEQRATRSVAGHGCKPAGIAVPKTAQEVGTLVRWARTAGVEITVRSGGNDFFGRNVTDDGLIIDMRDIDKITVARDKKTVTLGGGVVTQKLLRALDVEGLIVHAAIHGLLVMLAGLLLEVTGRLRTLWVWALRELLQLKLLTRMAK